MELTTNGLKLERDADGELWLHFGKYAMVNVGVIAAERPELIGRKIVEWAESQEEKR